ncbi:MAG: sulfurtransferase [Ornithinimicrobium sp.]
MVDPLIEPAELARQLAGDRPPILLDVRWQLGQPRAQNYADYLAGHLPDAAFLDLDSALSGPVSADGVGGRHPMPSTQTASDGFRAAGVRHDYPVAIYDGSTSLAAARAWWLLQYFGHEDARVLNGGYAAWIAADLPVASGSVQTPAGDVELRPGHRRIVSAQDVLELTEDPGSYLIDARAAERYRGEVEPIDPVAGHIPGALNVATLAALDPLGRFRSQHAVQQLASLGVDPDAPTTLYCGSGVQAMHLALTLEAAQPARRPPAVYVGSWSDWVSNASRPTRRGREASGRD